MRKCQKAFRHTDCPVLVHGFLSLPQTAKACLKIYFRHLYTPLCTGFVLNCGIHLPEHAGKFILTADFIGREYRASRSRKAAYFLMRLYASCYAVRQDLSGAQYNTQKTLSCNEAWR